MGRRVGSEGKNEVLEADEHLEEIFAARAYQRGEPTNSLGRRARVTEFGLVWHLKAHLSVHKYRPLKKPVCSDGF